MAFSFRANSVQAAVGGVLAPASGYSVTAYAAGGQVASPSSGATITLRANHGFTAGDKWLRINSNGSVTFSGSAIASTTSTTIVMASGSFSVSAGDVLINLGADTGTTSPAYNGSDIPTYSTMDGSSVNTSSTVTTDAGGQYFYWYVASETVWELIRNAAGTTVAKEIVPDAGAGSGSGFTSFLIFTTTSLPVASATYEKTLILVEDPGQPAVLKWAAQQSDGSFAWNDISSGAS